MGLKKFEDALVSYGKAIELKCDSFESFFNKGAVLLELKLFDVAIDNFDKAIFLKPEKPELFYNRGNAQQELKQFHAAVASYDKAIELKPDYAKAYSNRGNALQELKQYEAAVASYNKAIALIPDYADAYFNRGNILQELKQYEAAVASYDKAVALNSDYDYLFGMRLHIKMHLCDWQDFDNTMFQLSNKIQGNLKATPCLPVLALPISLEEQRKVAEIWCANKYPYNPSLGSIPKLPKRSKIRIGYFSADFHNHATTYLMAELFERHDKDKFELIAFSFGPNIKDEMRHRVTQAFDQFIDVTAMPDKAVALLSREMGVDIAVDLKGLTKDSRIGIFSYRAAPLQVSYLGYPGTLGIDYFDYLIADKVLIPTQSQQYYSEKIVYLPHSYQVNDRQRVVAQVNFSKQELGLPQEGFVFCCFNSSYKITPAVFDGWTRILKAVEKSVLWLIEDNSTAAVNLRKEAERRGLDPARLVFAKKAELSEHLARHKMADLFLDTLPYNAHTTASDALWAGVPVLTCMGEGFASRVAASLLHAIGLPEMVTTMQNDYEHLAIDLAKNPVKLKAIKDKLMENRLTTPLFDTALFTKHIEDAYSIIYERYQIDLMPDQIFVTENLKF